MECISEAYLNFCARSKSKIIKMTRKQLETMRTNSIRRKDSLKKKLVGLPETEKDDLSCHENCITYTSDFHINCYIIEQTLLKNDAGPSEKTFAQIFNNTVCMEDALLLFWRSMYIGNGRKTSRPMAKDISLQNSR